jgi:hypothetical protein
MKNHNRHTELPQREEDGIPVPFCNALLSECLEKMWWRWIQSGGGVVATQYGVIAVGKPDGGG